MFYGSKFKGWFEGLAEEVSRKHKGDSQYIGLTSDVANFCKSIRKTRNCVEHTKPDERVEVFDFSLTPNNEVVPPTIAVYHPQFTQPRMPVSAYTSQVTEHIANLRDSDCIHVFKKYQCIGEASCPSGGAAGKPTWHKLVKYSYGIDGGNQIIPLS
ncbi:hypothetical protein CT676_15990 [Bradyrhizobium sp. MOS001]|uniref:hypothetical protein n=1 Tax=Bradyrhizobium sp. MOS001 TaxID=2133948 RepID=UPI001074DE6C|nr:hypothetical protein [Bradyrhizobium sp. MOS001]TFW59992.1 hypothetical protein CT676_15990 [Bradyrhizobium sp. MOS001]